MTGYIFDYSIAFLDPALQIPESYYGIILDRSDIGSMREQKEVIFPSNIRNTELTNIQTIVVTPDEETAPRSFSLNALIEHVNQNNVYVVKKMLEKVKDLPTHEMYKIFADLLIYLIMNPNLGTDDMIGAILSYGQMPLNDYLPNSDTPLEMAIGFRNERLIKALVEKGADVNMKHMYDKNKDWTPLLFAIHMYPESVGYLLEKGANIHYKLAKTTTYNSKPVEIEIIAYSFPELIEKNDIPTIMQLLKAGADPNARDQDGATLLMRAAQAGNTDLINLLISSGADISLQLPSIYQEQFTAYDIYSQAHPTVKPSDDEKIKELLTKPLTKPLMV